MEQKYGGTQDTSDIDHPNKHNTTPKPQTQPPQQPHLQNINFRPNNQGTPAGTNKLQLQLRNTSATRAVSHTSQRPHIYKEK